MVEVLSQSKSPWRKTRVPRHLALAEGDRNRMLGWVLLGTALHCVLACVVARGEAECGLEGVGCSAGVTGNQMSVVFASVQKAEQSFTEACWLLRSLTEFQNG